MTPIIPEDAQRNGTTSKRRLVLYLSGKWEAGYASAIGPDDLLYCAPGFAEQAPEFDWQELPRLPRGSFDELARSYADLMFNDDENSCHDISRTLANTQFEYGICPIAAQLREIDRLISAERPQSLVVIASRSGMRHIPAIGVVTKEANRGSPHLLGALTAQAVVDSKPVLPVEWIVARGDPLSNPAIRYAVFRLVTIGMVLLAATRIMRSPIGTWKSLSRDCRVVVCVRSTGQAEHALRIFDGLGQVAIIVIPQFTGRNTMCEIARAAGERLTLFRPKRTDVLRALAGSIFCPVSPAGPRLHDKQHLSVGRFSIPISRAGLSREIRLYPMLGFHKRLLERSMARMGALRKLVGFEIKGPFAAAEAMAGRSVGVQTAVVKTVLVPTRPLPVFPWSDCFYADGVASADAIKNIGQRRAGQVTFVGSPHAVVPISLGAPLRSVVFLSQPYEKPQALSLLRALISAARHFGFSIHIRLHPRDNRESYQTVLEGANDVLKICDRKTLAESISRADLCVTRVSSAAKEALAAGKPIMICLWSEYDRSIVADYIARDALAERYVATNAAQLRQVLGNVEHLVAANAELQNRLFGDEGMDALREAILN